MEWLLLAAVAAVVVVGVVVIRRRVKQLRAEKERIQAVRERADRPQDPFQSDTLYVTDPRTITLGSLVEIAGASYTVRGTLTFTEGAYTWREHHFQTADGTRRWLCVEEDPDLKLSLWAEVGDHDLTPGREVAHRGVSYRRSERGNALYHSEGTTGLPAQGRVEYADYRGRDGQLLSLERFDGGEWELSTGQAVPVEFLRIYPPSS